jgi:TIR domain
MDRRQVNALVEQLRQAGVGVWLDSDLVGGQPWWDKILGQVRSCDAVSAAVSRAAVNSQACHFEREYAARLGKPVLPITLESMSAGLFPQDIARIQVVDYSQPSMLSNMVR